MTDIQIKYFNGTNWEDLFPKTKARLAELNDGKTVETAVTEILSSLSSKVTMAEVDAEIGKVIGAAPEALDTLQELADALGEDPNFATTVTNAINGKVDKVSGKGLSANDFTNALQTKLNTLPANAYTKAEVDNKIKNKVDKVSGKALSTNDFTNALQTKLNTLPANAYTKIEVDTRINNLAKSAIPVTSEEPTGATVWFETL